MARRRQGRARRRRQDEAHDSEDGGAGAPRRSVIGRASTASMPARSFARRISAFVAQVQAGSPDYLVTATLVEQGDVGEVVEAERVGFFERRWKTLVFLAFLVTVSAVIATAVVLGHATANQDEDAADDGTVNAIGREYCKPCIERPKYTIRAMIYATAGGHVMRSKIDLAARQSARDMGVQLDLKLFPEREYSEEQMADEIRKAAELEGVDALVVNIPSKVIANAVRFAAEKEMPVFGLNSDFELMSGPQGLVEEGSVKFVTGTNDRLAGEKAASYFLEDFSIDGYYADADRFAGARISKNFTQALFVSFKGESTVYQQRFEGYRDRLVDASNGTIKVEWFEVDAPMIGLRKKLSSCQYQAVLAGTGSLGIEASYAVDKSGCREPNILTKVGTFGTSSETDYRISVEEIDFAIDQYNHLQGWAAVQFAALYVTTGLVIVPPPSGVYLSGPVIYNKEKLMSQKLRVCTEEAYPVCSDTTETTHNLTQGEGCECTSRESIRIGGVVHGDSANIFWDAVSSAAARGAIDMGIELMFDRFDPQESNKILYEKMAKKVLNLCDSGVDGLFVTLSDSVVVDAVRKCRELEPNIQIMSINAGSSASKELNLLHHVGMDEKDAGYQAGKKMETMAEIDKAYCLNHDTGLDVLNERCAGFGQAIIELGIEYLGVIEVPRDDIPLYVSEVEDVVGETGEWEGYGFLIVGGLSTTLPAALELKNLHTNLVLGTFDTNGLLYQSLEDGDVLFGIDQQAYLQGYLPITILTHAVTTRQTFLDHSIKSGPSFVTAPPSDEAVACEDEGFPVCTNQGEHAIIQIAPPQTAQPTTSQQPSVLATAQPSSSKQPSTSPSFDRRPTLEIVQERGYIRCGFRDDTIQSGEGFFLDLCRAVSAVIFGDPDNIVEVPAAAATRFRQLYDRSVDLLLRGDSHTVEREVAERTTGTGFTFTTPYFYSGIAYLGNATFVGCAEEQKRFNECTSLRICVLRGTSGLDFVQSSFPSDFFIIGSSSESLTNMLLNGTCNVIARGRTILFDIASSEDVKDRGFVVGSKLMTKEPLAIVTRNNDQEFSDVVNWVVQALLYGEEQGLTKDSSLCQGYTNLTSIAFDLNFLNSVYCVGNYAEIVFGGEQSNRGMNQINDGSTGLLYAIPFGSLERDDANLFAFSNDGSLLGNIMREGSLRCGLVAPEGFAWDITKSEGLVGMHSDYCRALSASLFNGNHEAVTFLTFSGNDDSSFAALNNGTIDVLAGARIVLKHDFAGSSPPRGGFRFSTPYYYGNETGSEDVSFVSLATREDDVLFSSFVNCVVLATIYAQESIDSQTTSEVPLVSAFGNELKWALRDAVSYSGSYDQIYTKHFGEVTKEDRGRNAVNIISGPQLHSFPGLNHILS